MRSFVRRSSELSAEHRLNRLLIRLRMQTLGDAVLVSLPPLLAALYAGIYLFRSGWIPALTLLPASLLAILLASLAIAARYRSQRPTLLGTARLVDQTTSAKDRLITLATVEPSSASHAFLSRLRYEATEMLARVQPRRDFPFRLKSSFYKSLFASSFAIVVFHLCLPFLQARTAPTSGREEVRALAEKMVEDPALFTLAQNLQTLAALLEDPRVSQEEKLALIQELQNKLEEQQREPEQQANRDLLSIAGSTLRGLEQQQGSGPGNQNDSKEGVGGIQSNAAQDGQHADKSSSGMEGSPGDELRAELNGQADGVKSAQAKATEQHQKAGDGDSGQSERSELDTEKQKDATDTTVHSREEKLGRSKASQETPRGDPPAERFYRPGEEGKEGIKGAGYVTVQLPEEIAADSRTTTAGISGQEQTRLRPKVPVGNVPLPAHLPEAPTEKQHVPLEYRGIIR